MAATFDQIKEVRLTIADPQGFIDFVNVTTFSGLPVSPISQTAYRTEDTKTYYYHDGTAYVALKLQVSDLRVTGWIDSFGIDGAVLKSIQAIVAGLPAQLMIVRNSDGAESTEFLKLLDLQKFYQNWLKDLSPKDNATSSGKYFRTCNPEIAGGNL